MRAVLVQNSNLAGGISEGNERISQQGQTYGITVWAKDLIAFASGYPMTPQRIAKRRSARHPKIRF